MNRSSSVEPSAEVHAFADCLPLNESRAAWSYAWLSGTHTIEAAYWSGHPAPELHAHFHDEMQLTLVISGARSFDVEGRRLTATEGQLIVIPSGIPHRSAPVPVSFQDVECRCLNVYLPPTARQPRSAIALRVPDALDASGRVHLDRLIDTLERAIHRVARRAPHLHSHQVALTSALLPCGNVADIAQRQGMTREAFSRSFARVMGLPPHEFRLLSRLNEARRLLRGQEPIAEVAAVSGFADQSHLGRLFRRTFGTTPANYRKQMS
ncbi:AraC-like DNA-binding protein/mannose-6-phosphate isomerase-like protein (cupin superfamily) [Variovorax boronicumulans]|uniref:helix-turn-helix domain-containing protein n=1 Tax=Variovorax boronicumulans TaxID=436515 RepID=UPI0027803EB3|nr:AraC family transcriptional regulator [Variovorax boronicumulans]MDQ0083868.1 AraC-like DNA-binding protein/mannose-6-phosphate isomerase-like protein (cupin superfamily) [Variovorax boronicumulans]